MNTQPAHMTNSKGHLVPISLVKPEDLLEDQLVNTIFDFGVDLSAQLGRFKAHSFDDVTTFDVILAEDYGVTKGGPKGNKEYHSYDGLRKIMVSVQDYIIFGPQLQIAKQLIDECIEEWSDGSRDEIRALVNHAFCVEKTGNVNRTALSSLRRLNIEHPKWQEAMRAITNSIRVTGSKVYMRIYSRDDIADKFELVQLNISKL